MKVLLTTLHSKYIHASLALPYLKAFCQDVCADIHIREYSVNEPKEIVLAQIIAIEPDVIGFSVYLWNRLATLELVSCIKLINPNIRIVLGGPEVSFEAESFFTAHPVDCLIRGEGELPLRHVLSCWEQGNVLTRFPGLHLPGQIPAAANSLIDDLDSIPSPFQLGLVSLNKGLVYYESSRGCPYSCSFCMSALDQCVRSFSLERIKADLRILINARVQLIKFVDRTFNYNSNRAREIFTYILEHNISSQFHFEIGAHLIDEATLKVLQTVPHDVFQFEIGVQSTLPETLKKVGRISSTKRLAENIRRLKDSTRIHIHLDLIAGLPDETYTQFLTSIDAILKLDADHLQIEPVKLLPGAPLRQQAVNWGITFDPQPPYTILKSSGMSFDDLERLRGIGRLLDIFVNSGRFSKTLDYLCSYFSGPAKFLEALDLFWRTEGLYSQSHALKTLYSQLDRFLCSALTASCVAAGRECLARDYALNERLMTGNAPDFFDLDLSDSETAYVKEQVKSEIEGVPRCGKVQYCAAVFHHLTDFQGRTVLIYLYFSKTGEGMKVVERALKISNTHDLIDR